MLRYNSIPMMSVILFSMILFSCKDKSVTTADSYSPEAITKYKVGNYWVYKDVDFDSTGILKNTLIDTMKVLKDTVISGEAWYILDASDYAYTNKAGGLYSYHLVGDRSISQTLKYPGLTGDIFERYFYTVKILKTDTVITLPSGIFKCYCYFTGDSSFEAYDFWCPDIGQVKFDYFVTTQTGRKYLSSSRSIISMRLQ